MKEPIADARPSVTLIIVMGVAGSGKSTIGPLLAEALQCAFLEGDSLHPPANIEKMHRGTPLTDKDRTPWLAAIRAQLHEAFQRGECLIVACSALKESYRDYLAGDLPIVWVYLAGGEELIRARLEARTGHFLPTEMLASQLRTLEVPAGAIVADISQSPREVVEGILAELGEG